jgi:flagellar basal-body rod protein FlgG
MIKGLYRSASGMIPHVKMQEITANNLANASAPGFKRDMLFVKELSKAQAKNYPTKSDWETPMIDQVYTDYDQGMLDKTENPLDLAIEGDGFFSLELEDGALALSRNGSFTVDQSGYLVNSEGHRVLGDGGPINVGQGEVSISETGQVEVDESLVGNIRIVMVADPKLLNKIGMTEFLAPENVEPLSAKGFSIKQGYLETSNVNVIKEMVNMVISYRNFESDAQAVKAQDESLEKLINNVGRSK